LYDSRQICPPVDDEGAVKRPEEVGRGGVGCLLTRVLLLAEEAEEALLAALLKARLAARPAMPPPDAMLALTKRPRKHSLFGQSHVLLL
jgi:hypothetical protein